MNESNQSQSDTNHPPQYRPNNKQQSRQSQNNSSKGYSCSASSANRIKVLCNNSSRKGTIGEIKRLLKEVQADIANKLMALIQEIVMDADYRERTNIQMRDMVVGLEEQIINLQKRLKQQSSPIGFDTKLQLQQIYVLQLQESLQKYQKLLNEADNQKLQMLDEITNLKQENYQIRLQLSNSKVDNETEQLIEQLTLQLEQQKYANRDIMSDNQSLRHQVIDLEKELHQKNKRIKLLSLNLNLKDAGNSSRISQRK